MDRIKKYLSAYRIMLFVCVFCPVFTSSTLTALPPGYEDEILCHSTACLRPVPRPYGWSGARTNFLECCEPATGDVSRPRSWGWRLDIGYRAELLKQGWASARQCTAYEAERCGKNKTKWIDVFSTINSLECSVNKLLNIAASFRSD